MLAAAPEAPIPWVEESVIEKARQMVVAVCLEDGSRMTGFVASPKGLVVTSAAHLEGHKAGVTLLTSDMKPLRCCKMVALPNRAELRIARRNWRH